jgi:hypothetical protein
MTVECYAAYIADVKVAGEFVKSGFFGDDQIKAVIGKDIRVTHLSEGKCKNRFMLRAKTQEQLQEALAKIG